MDVGSSHTTGNFNLTVPWPAHPPPQGPPCGAQSRSGGPRLPHQQLGQRDQKVAGPRAHAGDGAQQPGRIREWNHRLVLGGVDVSATRMVPDCPHQAANPRAAAPVQRASTPFQGATASQQVADFRLGRCGGCRGGHRRCVAAPKVLVKCTQKSNWRMAIACWALGPFLALKPLTSQPRPYTAPNPHPPASGTCCWPAMRACGALGRSWRAAATCWCATRATGEGKGGAIWVGSDLQILRPRAPVIAVLTLPLFPPHS
jgi:hypothetical protein